IQLSGDPNDPATWTGSMVSTAGPLRAGATSIDQISARADAKDGTAVLNLGLNSGRNRIDAVAKCALPKTIDGFTGTDIDGTLTVAADELEKFAAQITQGKVTADG